MHILKILLADDNPHLATLLREGVQMRGRREMSDVTFEFTTVVDGQQALAALEQEEFHLLLIDIYMPVMSGQDVIRKVKADPRLQHLPVVAVSAGGAAARKIALRAGADQFLDKPFQLTDVLAILRRLTGKGGTE